ncbi:GNAT family N-acetyltransferase [Arthrobacter sp. ISL-65]|uniref:GNAT family N-acetyltransferase n=1 Tax=Arthrobacter sp. ISL-65 TaxID=2819112 RepID=UPI001BEB9614|nr:GNAT family N-acetyltransferase [Arthrobacter sp. ISL-65]MBT2550427.1 GNAT family N-acetyltransferase [Arthrobacter sp. ISL-65]
MSGFITFTSSEFSDAEVLSLYESVGWSAYTRDRELLIRAIRSSSFVVTARNDGGGLVGLARVVSDDATICFLQDILVRPAFQKEGVGRALLEHVLARYQHVRQTVLITDDEPGQRAFYEAMGFTEGSNFSPAPIRVFAQFR